ncbi:hypothetical protein ACHAXN_003770 [Cyclotella atomus]
MLSASSQTLAITSASLLLHTSSANLFDHLKQPRIIGGIAAPSQRYPYTVALTNGGSDFFCGGSLIAVDVVLTAAHCIGGGSYSVAVGRDDLTSNDGQEIPVAQEIRHPSYSWDTDENDLALLLLSEAVTAVPEEDIVRINSDASFPSAGDLARSMGWGDTDPDDFNAVVSDELLEVDLPVISNEECSAAKGTDNGYTDSYESYIFDSMLCTFEPGLDACQGDSGGPLIIPGESASQDILIGVTSWGIGCATKVFPGVFARVSHSYDWIAETVCAESANPPGYLCGTPEPSAEPTRKPTPEPTPVPSTATPTLNPSEVPTDSPTTLSPSINPSKNPTESPSYNPTLAPTSSPSESSAPSSFPSSTPSLRPSDTPTANPSSTPSQSPSITSIPSNSPTESPTLSPTVSAAPTVTPAPTPRPFSVGGNSLMIPISALLSSDKDGKTISFVESSSEEDDRDDDEFSSSAEYCGARSGLVVGMLLSGLLALVVA